MSGTDDPAFRVRDRELQAVALLRSFVTTSGDAFDEEYHALLPTDREVVGALLGMLTVARRLLGVIQKGTGQSDDDLLTWLRNAVAEE